MNFTGITFVYQWKKGREAPDRPESQQNKLLVVFKRIACLSVKKMHQEMEEQVRVPSLPWSTFST